MPDTKWQITITSPDGVEDRGSITLLSLSMTPAELARRMAEIAWRITHDLAAEREAKAAEEPPGGLTHEVLPQ